MVSLLCGGFSMRGHLTFIRAAFVALFLSFSFSAYADTYPAQTRYIGYNNALFDDSSLACDSYGVLISSQYGSNYCGQMRISGTTTGGLPMCQRYVKSGGVCTWFDNGGINRVLACPYGGTLSGATCINAPACDTGQARDSVTGECKSPPPPECDLGKELQPDGHSCACPSGQYQQFGAPDPNPCGVPSCPAGYYINLTVADGYYDCTVQPPDCPLPVPMCSNPSYECMGEASTPTEIPSCDNTCPAGQHASGGSCVPDDEAPVQCPPNYQYNVVLASCEFSPPIVCQQGYKAGKVNGENVCVASTEGAPIQTPTKNTATTTTTSVTTTTIYDNNGNQTGTSVSTTSGTSTTTLDTSGLAQDSTVKAVLDTLTGTTDRSGDAYQGGGSGSAPSSNGTALATKKTELQAMINSIKTEFSALKPMMASGGSITCDGGVDLSFVNAHFEICLEPYTEQLSRIGYGVYLVAAAFAVMIILG